MTISRKEIEQVYQSQGYAKAKALADTHGILWFASAGATSKVKQDWRDFKKPTGLWADLRQAELAHGYAILRHEDETHPIRLMAQQRYAEARAKLKLPPKE